MGCDIHLYFEIKNKNGKWEEIRIDDRLVPDDRDYHLFALLAGVRNHEDPPLVPLFANRGIPEDCSYNQEKWNDISDHSNTHAYLNEILDYPWWEEQELDTSYFYIFCVHILPRLYDYFPLSLRKEEQKNIRIIMGFDN